MPNRREIQFDRSGQPTQFKYDSRGNVLSVTDPLGRVTRNVYDDNNRVLCTVDPSGRTNLFAYDSNGHRNAITNAMGEITRFAFDNYGQLRSKTDASGNSIAFDYNSAGRRTRVMDAMGHETRIGHDIYGRPTAITNALNQLRATAGSDELGELQFVSQPGGLRMDYARDVNGNTTNTSFLWINPDDANQVLALSTYTELDAANRITRVTDPDGQSRQTIYDAAGRVAQSIDRMGNSNSFLYDANGNLIQTTYADGLVDRSVYDINDRLVYAVDRHLPPASANGMHQVYDAAGRVVRVERLANVQIEILYEGAVPRSVLTSAGAVLSAAMTTYDSAGRVLATTNALGHVTRYEYDDAGRQTAVINALNQRTDSVYDEGGRLLATAYGPGLVTRYEYDAKGRRIKTIFPDQSYLTNSYNEIGQLVFTIDQGGLRTDYEFDELGRMAAVLLPEVFDPEGGTNARPRYEYEYDQAGNLLVLRDAKGRETKSTYDAFGQLISQKLPLLQTNHHTYNALGQLEVAVDFMGQSNRLFYDVQGRVVTNWLYAAGAATPGQTNAMEYGPGGQYLRILRPEGETVLTYNLDGAVTNISSPEGVIHYEYDPVAGYLTRAYTVNSDVRYAYDELGRLQTVTVVKRNGLAVSPPEVTRHTYTRLGSLENVHFPNGTRTFHQYDALNRLTNVVHYDSSNQVLGRYEYTVAADGRRLAATETRLESGGGYSTTQIAWTYDNLRRLVREASSSTAAALNFTNSYVYDLAGNRLWKTNVTSAGTQVTGCAYNANDQLVTDGAFTSFYNANGSVTNRFSATETNVYAYNLEGRLASATIRRQEGGSPVVQTNKYFYNASGIRTRVETTGTGSGTNVFLNDPQNLSGFSQVWEELPVAGATPTVTYTLGSRVLSQEQGGVVSHLMADGHGSTRLITGVSGVISDRYSFDAYGVPLEFQPEVLTPPRTKMLYTGEQYDVGLRQIYLRARYYNPAVGRFGVRDTVEGMPGDPLTLHKYAYGHNNPVNLRDPSGNFGLMDLSMSVGIQATLFAMHNLPIAYLGSKLMTEAADASESLRTIDSANSSPSVDTATLIIHGVSGHSPGWTQSKSTPFQQNLSLRVGSTPTAGVTGAPLNHDFYEFNWGGFSIAGFGLIPVKSVHRMAFVHLQMAQMLVWMKGYANVNIISHSWGTTLSYDLLNSGGIEMHDWVTMGSPLNHGVSKPLWNAGKWVNFYSFYDPIVYLDMYPDAGWSLPVFFAPSFSLSIFNPPQVDNSLGKNMTGAIMLSIPEHGAYWDDKDVLTRIRGELQ